MPINGAPIIHKGISERNIRDTSSKREEFAVMIEDLQKDLKSRRPQTGVRTFLWNSPSCKIRLSVFCLALQKFDKTLIYKTLYRKSGRAV